MLPNVALFRIDVLDASNNVLGDGPLTHVLGVRNTARLDAIGEAIFALPAADPRGALIVAGRKFDIYVVDDPNVGARKLGRYRYRSKELSEQGGQAVLSVQCWDALRDLTKMTTGFRRTYVNQAVDVVVEDLVSVVGGWTVVADTAIGNTTVSFEGESPLVAVDALRDRWNKHYRLGDGDFTLEFGAFGDDSGVRLVDLRGQEQTRLAMRPEIAFVERIRLVEEADEIFNVVIPLGAGQGVSQLTIEQATLGSYTVQTGTNADGSTYYYIKDTASVAAYEESQKVLTFPQIRPITNSDENIVNAANALKLSAEAYIARHLAPRVTYEVSVRALRQGVKPGDTVHLQYRGVVEGYGYIDVDGDFYVMDITYDRQADGTRSVGMVIASIAERRTSDTDVVLEVMHDIRALKVHVPITIAYSPVGPYVQRIDSVTDAEFTVRIGEEVLALNYAKLRLKTTPLKSSVQAAASGGGSNATSASGGSATPTSSSGGSHRHLMFDFVSSIAGAFSNRKFQAMANAGGLGVNETNLETASTDDLYTYSADGAHDHTVSVPAHTHDVTIPAHTHDLTYGIFEDSTYPQTIRLFINGTDRSAELGGPWAPTNAALGLEVDITTYLADAIGGLRQNHRVVFTCGAGRGEIEAEIDMLVTIQPIAVS